MAITTLERTQIEKVFIAFLNAAPSITYLDQLVGYAGRADVLAKDLSKTDSFLSIYPVALTNAEFAGKFVANFIGSTASDAAKAYVKDEVVKSLNAGVSRGDTLFNVVVALQSVPDGDATFGTTKKAFENKVAVADYYAVTKLGTATDLTTLHNVIAGVTASSDVSSSTALDAILSGTVTGQTFTLTNGTDVATANVFSSGLVYNPAGTDRVNALQNEDTLTGTGTNPTLNVTLGNKNDNGGATVTPILNKIETINAQFTGDTATLDVRFADSLKTLAVTRVTADAGNTITFDNINQPAANLTVSNTASVFDTFNFNYTTGVLPGTTAGTNAETGTLMLSAVTAEKIHIGNVANTEGFETLNLNSAGSNTVKKLEAVDLENLNITGSGNLTLVNTSNLVKGGVAEGVKFDGDGIAIGDGLGIRTIDASGFAGTLGLDISAAVQGHNDPANSGQKYYATITGGTGNDTFWTNKDLRASQSNGKDTLNGNGGTNTLKLINSSITLRNAGDTASADTGNIGDVGYIAAVTGITNLELRSQDGSNQLVNFLTFTDAGPTNVTLRNETGGAPVTFTLENVGTTLAGNGNIVLNHGVDVTKADVVKIQLADATGTNDSIALTVVNDLNTTTQYDYTLNTTAMKKTTAGVEAVNGKVENVTINDKDTESNVVTLANAADHIGTVTLKGGVAGQFYKVNYADGTNSPLVAATIDASGQASNLFLQTAPAAATVQTVKLGTGNDALLFANTARDAGSLDLLKGSETITDAGGTDVVTAIFSKDVSGKPTFTGVETFQTAATANVALDLSSTGLTTLNLLSQEAVNGTGGSSDQFALAAGSIVKTSIITANGTSAVSTLNFAGSNDDGINNTTVGSFAQVFNGVTLNVTAPTLNVNINSRAVGLDNVTHAEAGAVSYTLGQLTSQGTTTMNIVISDELAIAAGATKSATTTTVDNIWAKNLETLNVTANGDVNLGTITGGALNNNQKLVDATAVKGIFTATDIALGNDAQVKIGNGGSIFNALGSAGKNVVITAGNGVNTITGTAQNDTITTGSKNDTVNGDRGDNIITVGAGNDTVTAKDGNNTINLGSGTLETVQINVNTANANSLSTNVITGNGTVANVDIAKLGAAATFSKAIAVAAGHDLALSWLGDTIQLGSSTLDGRVAYDARGDVVGYTNPTGLTGAGTAAITADNSNAYVLVGDVGNKAVAAVTLDFTKATSAVFLDYTTGGVADGAQALTIKGSNGADAFVLTNNAANTITAGTGADFVVLSTQVQVDTINIGDGNSTLSGYDQYYNFGGTDKLVLTTANIAATVGLTDSTQTTTISGASQKVGYAITANGLVTFTSAGSDGVFGNGNDVALKVGTSADNTHITLAQAVSIINAKAGALNAAVFAFDANNDGDTVDAADGSFVVENTTNGTVVELVGVNAAVGLTAAAGAFTVA